MSFRNARQKHLYTQYYKQGLDESKLKRDREDKQWSIRKKKRASEIAKRRNISSDINDNTMIINPKLELLPEYANDIRSSDYNTQLKAISCVRELLAASENPPIEQVIVLGIAQDLVNILNYSKDTTIQYQTAWALSNIAAGTNEQTNALLDYGAVPAFISILSGNYDMTVKNQAIWALGNIAADSTPFRDYILYQNILDSLIEFINGPTNSRLQITATWCIANLCRGSPPPPFDITKQVVPSLLFILQSNECFEQIRSDACWALAQLADSNVVQIKFLLSNGLLDHIIPLLSSSCEKLYTPAVRVIGNIVAGEDNYCDKLIELNVINLFGNIIHSSSNYRVLTEIAWTLSNFISISNNYINNIIYTPNLIDNLLHNIDINSISLKIETAWIFTNIASVGSIEQCNFIVNHGILGSFSYLLTIPDIQLLSIAIEGIKYILDCGKKGNNNIHYCNLFDELGGLSSLYNILHIDDNLSLHDNIESILKDHFDNSMEDEEEQYIEPFINSNISSNNNNNNSIFNF